MSKSYQIDGRFTEKIISIEDDVPLAKKRGLLVSALDVADQVDVSGQVILDLYNSMVVASATKHFRDNHREG